MKKKGCCLGCLGFLSLAVSILALVMALTRPVVEAGETFLGQLSQGKFHEAYTGLAPSSQKQLDEARFKDYAVACKVDQYASASWSSRKIENDRGYLSGRFTTRSGESFPIDIFLIKEGDAWRILDYQVLNGGSVPASTSSPGTPPPDHAMPASPTPVATGSP